MMVGKRANLFVVDFEFWVTAIPPDMKRQKYLDTPHPEALSLPTSRLSILEPQVPPFQAKVPLSQNIIKNHILILCGTL